MKSAIALIAVAGFAGAANAQATVDVLVDGAASGGVYQGDETVVVSIVLNRNASADGFYANFSGWSQFAGDLNSSAGSFIAPVELPTPGETQADPWEGRRPPAFPVPGGSAGGFRFSPDNSVTNGGSIEGIEGIAASTALGGFSHDTAGSIMVYRASLDLTGGAAGDHTVDFAARLLQVFIDGFAIERAVLDNTTFNSASFTIVPTPASVALLGLGGLATTRRRR